MLTKADLRDEREKIQDSLITLLDGFNESFITQVCQVIVDRFELIIEKCEKD